MPPRVALATAAAALPLDDDLPPLVAALAGEGIHGAPSVWDDPTVDWAPFDLVVVRSTWDYPPRRAAFLAWVDRVAATTPVLNPPAVIRWNTDKWYLAELAAAGLPVVETAFVSPGEPFAPPPFEHVVKPAVSAGALDTARFGPGDPAATDLVARLHAAGRTAMCQPYLSAVDGAGERGVVHIDGELSHAFTKGALLRRGAGLVEGLFAPEEISAAQASAAELAVAAAVHRWVEARFGTLLYERVDLVAGLDGTPVVLELELAEPSLYHAHGPGSAARLAAAISARLGATPGSGRPAMR